MSQVTRLEQHEPITIGQRIADGAAAGIGSWRFIVVQTILVLFWVLLNQLHLAAFDLYPFILLNLMFSVQAAYTGPILLLAGNRQAQRDRAMAAKDDEEIGLLLKLQQDQMRSHDWQTTALGLLLDHAGITLPPPEVAH